MNGGKVARVAFLMITGLAACAVHAGEALTVSVKAYGEDMPETAVVEAVSRTDPETSERFEVSLENGEGVVAFATGMWRLQASAPGYLSAAVTVDDPSVELVDLVLWPAVEVVAQINMMEDAQPPQSVFLTLNEVPGATTAAATQPESAEARCEITGNRLEACLVPAGNWHLRMRAPKYIPRYFWNLPLPANESVDLGEVVFERGAHLFGEVETSDGTSCSRDARVELRPLINRYVPGQTQLHEELDNLTEAASINPWGYFQFSAIDPGEYELTAVDSGFMPATVPRLTIKASTQVELREPLVLQRALEMIVLISPREDPTGQPWTIRVYDASLLGTRNVVAEGVAINGEWASPHLAAGPLFVSILDANGSRLVGEEVELSRSNQILEIELSLVPVSGRVEFGDERIRAQLLFTTGSNRIETDSDEDGQFDVVLPKPGTWRVGVRSDELDIDYRGLEIEIDREGERLVIEVPDTALQGEVVYANTGRPAADAQIQLVNMTNQEFSSPYDDVAGSDGRFELRGLEPGTYRIEASHGQLKSPLETVQVSEAEATPIVQLVLQKRWRLNGRVSSGSNPVPAAMIWAVPFTAQGTYASTSAPHSRSLIDGSFTIGVSDDAEVVRLVTMAPGHAMQASTATRWHDNEHDEDLVIDLRAESGSLRLSAATRRGVVFIDGNPIPYGFLTQWAMINGQPQVQDQDLVVPWMPAGEYIFCDLSDDEATMVLAGVAVPRKDVCSVGFLGAGETLSISPPRRQ